MPAAEIFGGNEKHQCVLRTALARGGEAEAGKAEKEIEAEAEDAEAAEAAEAGEVKAKMEMETEDVEAEGGGCGGRGKGGGEEKEGRCCFPSPGQPRLCPGNFTQSGRQSCSATAAARARSTTSIGSLKPSTRRERRPHRAGAARSAGTAPSA